MIDFDIKVAKIRQFLKTGGAADMTYREQEKIIEEAQKNQSKQKDIFKSLYKSIDSQKKFGKAKRLILENYQKLEEAYLIWIQAIQKVSQNLTNPNLLRQGKNTLNQVFTKVSYNEPNYSQCIDRLMIPKLVDKPNLEKFSKQILERKKKLAQSASALPEIKTKKSFKPIRQRQQSSQSIQKVQKQKPQKEQKKAKVQKERPERNINWLLQKKIKETAATYGLASVEAGYYNQFNQLFNKFLTNLLQKLIRYSSIQNEGHPHLGTEFKLFEKKGEFPQSISWLIPFNNCYTDPYSMSSTKKRRVIELYKSPVFNPLQQYTKLLQQDMKFQSAAVRQLADDIIKARDKRDIQKDVLQTLLYESKGLTAQSHKLYQEAQSLREHGQKPQSKRLTLRLAGVQCWLQESGMSHLLEKSYLK